MVCDAFMARPSLRKHCANHFTDEMEAIVREVTWPRLALMIKNWKMLAMKQENLTYECIDLSESESSLDKCIRQKFLRIVVAE